MSAAHKNALAQGRRNARAVKAYLEAIEQNRPKRGRQRTRESIKRQLAAVEAEWESAGALKALGLAQRRMDLENELQRMDEKPRLASYEADFVKHAKAYAKSKGISYAAFREVGVPVETLRKAGITR
jgi:hypothetical protein